MTDSLELLSKGQMRALQDTLEGRSVFITGGAGVGKSFLIKTIKEKLEEKGKKVALTSSTGISAINIGGNTIHSFCGTGLRGSVGELRSINAETISRTRNYITHFDTIIVDEVSMLSGDYLDMMDVWFQRVWKRQSPFGGRQMIFVGDLLQLPPVITDKDLVSFKFAFQSDAWVMYDVREHFLTKIFRQEDKETQHYLNCIRFGKVTDEVLKYFNSKVGAKLKDPEPTELYPLKKSVNQINFDKLDKLPGKEWEYEATFTGEESWQQAIAKNTIADICVFLKVGAPVLFIKNNPDLGYFNGMKGFVRECKEESVVVESVDGNVIEVGRETWEKKGNDGEVLATMSQIPLILGWAITIHKSQGMTIEYLRCDLSGCFECGQAYTALSRMKSMDGLSLKKPIKRRDIKTSEEVIEYYRHLYKLKKNDINNK